MTMRVSSWHIYNPKNKLFWSNSMGWVDDNDCDSWQDQEGTLPIDGIWVPHIIGGCVTTDDLITALNLFPPGTRLTGYADKDDCKYSSVKVFGQVLNKETREDIDPEDELAELYAVIALF